MSLPEARAISYYQIASGMSGVHFEWSFQGRPRSRFGVELHFEKGEKEDNLWLITRIKEFIPELEKKLGQKFQVVENWGRNWSKILVYKDEGEMTEDLKLYAIEKMEIMYRFIQPKIDQIKDQFNSRK